ncbi:hypothetical protein CLV62_11749 [Dysgonomonas alginatilytica]|uniref:Uncharacterized protein n=1 Tax=Dysgonomonas alginatilytica TaxID=1605892 RepID=A0A2V3PPM7_9BACT|nr:hypothetical protein [Dysgonomonas alginatilytica]PXV62833.1 hypothetical protein CLV62_11749 [Dysgonomonas alginatilytica]
MSFDLYLYKRKESEITQQNITDYLNDNLPFNISEYSHQWYYSNEKTGVYFIIEKIEEEDLEDFPIFEDFISLNFTLYINYLRPSYFGLEIFPLIDKLMIDLDIYIFNPQEDSEINTPYQFDKNHLQNQWVEQNNQFSLVNYMDCDLQYFPLEESNYAWKYMYQREHLQESLTEDVFVCGIFFIKNKLNNIIYTFTIWPEHLPIIIPPVDYVMIVKKYRKLFKKVEESGLVPYNSVIDKFKDYFKPFESEIPDLMIISLIDSDKISKQFNQIKLWKTVEEFGIMISKDSFVNVKPD